MHSVYTNSGSGVQSGSFVSNSCPVVGTNNAYFVAAADLYRKGQAQLITYCYSAGLPATLLVLTNNGSGKFGSNNITKSFGGQNAYVTTAPIAADIFGNGYPALIFGVQDFSSRFLDSIVIMTNNGSGVFSTNSIYGIGSLGGYLTPNAIVAADLNGDGKLDLVVGCGSGSTYSPQSCLVVLTNNGSGRFATNTTINLFEALPPRSPVADVNADGRPDLIAASIAYVSGGGLVSELLVYPNLSPIGAGPLYSAANGQGVSYLLTPETPIRPRSRRGRCQRRRQSGRHHRERQ